MAAETQDQGNDHAPGRWDDVRFFLAAYRHRSLGAAAARLGLDTSTTSRRLAAFEAALGVRLFERTRAGLVPTRAAELALPAAELMEAAHGRLERDASERESSAEGVVRVSADPGVAEIVVAPALVHVRARHPKITVELDVSDRVRDLTRHEADLALRTVAPRGAELLVTKLATAPWSVATGPALAGTIGRVSSWGDVPWITWDRDLASFAPALWVKKHVPGSCVVLRTSGFAAQLAAAASGLGVGLFPAAFARARGLVTVRPAPALAPSTRSWPESDVWLVGHRALRSVPRVAAVWDVLARECRRALARS